MLESGELVKLKQANGSTEYNIKINSERPWDHKEKLHMVYFDLPYGYNKYAFSLEAKGSEGDVAEAYWASDDPDDARIILHAKKSRSLKKHLCQVSVLIHDVYAKKKWK